MNAPAFFRWRYRCSGSTPNLPLPRLEKFWLVRHSSTTLTVTCSQTGMSLKSASQEPSGQNYDKAWRNARVLAIDARVDVAAISIDHRSPSSRRSAACWTSSIFAPLETEDAFSAGFSDHGRTISRFNTSGDKSSHGMIPTKSHM